MDTRKISSYGVQNLFWIFAVIFAFAAVIGFMGGCDSPANPGGGFAAVSSITGVPTSGTVGNLTLSGTVNPSGATNKTIAWSVVSAGTTGASISGSTLTTTAAGTVTVRATIANGAAQGTNYTQDFNITISPAVVNPNDITYSVEQIGGVNGQSNTTGIVFTFSASVDRLGLTAADITVVGAASKGPATFTKYDGSWLLSPITVDSAGLATVSIAKNGIEAATKSVTVYKAGETAPEYWSITWNLNGGTEGTGAYPTLINKGDILAQPSPNPTRANYTFGGWYTDSGFTQTYTFANPVTSDLNLYAKWEAGNQPSEYWSITWHLNDGTEGTGNYPAQIERGTVLDKPSPDPTKANYTFGGWYTDSGLTQEYDFTNPATGDLNLYAKWVQPPAGTPVTGSTLAAKLAWLSSNAQSNTTYTIEVTANEAIGRHTLSYTNRSNITVILWGSGSEKIVSHSGGTVYLGSLFTVESGVTLVLDNNVTLRGLSGSNSNSSTGNNNASLVRVNSGGALIMNTGAKITGNTAYNTTSTNNGIHSYGGGVYMGGNSSSRGTFTMNGGEISGNTAAASSNPTTAYGGGVYVADNGTFTMSGGEISGNTASSSSNSSVNNFAYGGGVYVALGGIFTMDGGEISGNTAAAISAANAFGGGVYVGGYNTTIGGTAQIYGNTNRGGPNNIYLADGRYITLGSGSKAPAYGMNVYVQTATASGVIVQSGATAEAAQYFHAEQSGKVVGLSGTQLVIMNPRVNITWNLNGGTAGTGTYPDQIDEGTVLAKPSPDPIRAGNTFAGWYADSGLTQAYNFSSPVNVDLYLYAKWRVNTLAENLAWVLNENNVQNGQTYTIEVSANEVINPHTLTYANRSNITIILQGAGGERIISVPSNLSSGLFTVESGVTLILNGNITLQGGSVPTNDYTYNTYSLVIVNTGGALEINTGAKITGNTCWEGGGVYVASNGTFTMNGGEISGNTSYSNGGGVFVASNGTFTMNGGEISGNTTPTRDGTTTSYMGGGVFASGSFTLTGGTISNNTAGQGGGVGVINGPFTMTGGEIFGNTIFYPSFATIGGGGGVSVGSNVIFTKSGGTIYGYSPSDTINSNVVKDSDNDAVLSDRGHAVNVWVDSSPHKRRETTAGPGVNLDSRISGSAGGWEN